MKSCGLLEDKKVDTNGFGLVFSVFVGVTGDASDMRTLEVQGSAATDRAFWGDVKQEVNVVVALLEGLTGIDCVGEARTRPPGLSLYGDTKLDTNWRFGVV